MLEGRKFVVLKPCKSHLALGDLHYFFEQHLLSMATKDPLALCMFRSYFNQANHLLFFSCLAIMCFPKWNGRNSFTTTICFPKSWLCKLISHLLSCKHRQRIHGLTQKSYCSNEGRANISVFLCLIFCPVNLAFCMLREREVNFQ